MSHVIASLHRYQMEYQIVIQIFQEISDLKSMQNSNAFSCMKHKNQKSVYHFMAYGISGNYHDYGN